MDTAAEPIPYDAERFFLPHCGERSCGVHELICIRKAVLFLLKGWQALFGSSVYVLDVQAVTENHYGAAPVQCC
ncbi:hypothetical protein SRHO_G00034920 [Serrasalmus rhombeus]